MIEPPAVGELPLWAQVLLAGRMARRAADGDELRRIGEAFGAGCTGAAESGWHRRLLEDARRLPESRARACAEAALDAAFAAESSLDFSAAESACTSSTLRAIEEAGASPALNPLQAQILAASDVDLLRFAAEEAGVGRYDPLPASVLGRLTSVS